MEVEEGVVERKQHRAVALMEIVDERLPLRPSPSSAVFRIKRLAPVFSHLLKNTLVVLINMSITDISDMFHISL
ncbi:MAG: hypothetical protein LKF06_08250 [Prevotella sp.]|nr:hypothetical protein [Prevotella sp.]